MLPRGHKYLDNKIQFVHVDDMARLLVHILRREPEMQRLTILNVAGRGDPLTFGRCIELAGAKLVRVPKSVYRASPGAERIRPGSRTPVRNLFLAGCYVDTKFPASVEGAVRSARLAVDAVLTAPSS